MSMWESGYKVPKYSSYKKQWFEKYLQRQKALLQGVKDSSLKEEDKKALIEQMKKILG